VRSYLSRHSSIGQDFFDAVDAESQAMAEHVRSGCRALPDPDPLSVFDHVHVELTAELREQRNDFARYLASVEDSSS
jgi:2-oxoisovalerate dehydrogenase E1 component alpha subunit